MKPGHSSWLSNPYVTYSDSYTKGNIFENTSNIEYVVFNIPPGVDIIKWVEHFAKSKKGSVTVLGGSGLLSEVAVWLEPKVGPVTFFERFNLISLTGIFYKSETFVSCSLTAMLAKMDGSVIGGLVSKLVTMTHVVLKMVICNDTEFIGANSKILARL